MSRQAPHLDLSCPGCRVRERVTRAPEDPPGAAEARAPHEECRVEGFQGWTFYDADGHELVWDQRSKDFGRPIEGVLGRPPVAGAEG